MDDGDWPADATAAGAAGTPADRLVTGIVNAWTSDTVSADDIATWMRNEDTGEARARVALSTFFLEVPLAVQVAFLDSHGIEESVALAFAERIELLGRTLPLRLRARW